MGILRLIKFGTIALLILTLKPMLHSADLYKINRITGKMDLYHTDSEINLIGGSTNFIQNRRTLQSGTTFFVSSGTVGEVSMFQSTIQANTGKFQEIFTSTIHSNSPLTIIADGEPFKFKNLGSTPTFIIPAGATIVQETSPNVFATVINSSIINVSSASMSNVTITSGSINMVNSSIYMDGNGEHCYDPSNTTCVRWDEANKWLRHYLLGVEMYRLEY